MRRLLLVTNVFPPKASGGIARQLRFLKYLPEFGWETTVLTARMRGPVPDPEGVRIIRTVTPGPDPLMNLARCVDHTVRRARALSDTGTRKKTPSPEPISNATHSSRSVAFKGWAFIPDPYVGWIAPATIAGKRLLRREAFDAILSSSPGGSAHLAAASLARWSGLPWLADYRDPWPTNHYTYFPTAAHRRAAHLLEARALRYAAMATAVNEPIAQDLLRRHPHLAGRVEVLSNGFDPVEDVADVALGEGFWIVYTGRLYRRIEETTRFLDALAQQPNDVNILFLGIADETLSNYARKVGCGERVHLKPFVQRPQSLGYQRAAHALLLIPGMTLEALSSKVFEYLVSGRPVFAITSPDSVAARLLAEVGNSRVVPLDSDLPAELSRFIAEVRSNALPPADKAVVARYDGRLLTGRLAGFLDSLAETRHSS